MSTQQRIKIDNLPTVENLTKEELEAIFGAGRARLNLEGLEDRLLMASNLVANLSDGLLRIEGTPGADTIHVRQLNEQISVVGISIQSGGTGYSSVNSGAVQRIVLDTLAGDDDVWINNGSEPLTRNLEIPAGAGHDVLHSLGTTANIGQADGVVKTIEVGSYVYQLRADRALYCKSGTGWNVLRTNIADFLTGRDGLPYARADDLRVYAIGGSTADYIFGGMQQLMQARDGTVFVRNGSGELYTVQGVRLTSVLSGTDPLVKTSDGLLYTRGANGRVYAIGGPTADYIFGGMQQMMQASDGTLFVRDGNGGLYTVQGVRLTSVLSGTDPLVKTSDGLMYMRGADGRVYAIGSATVDYICGGMQQLMQARDGTVFVRNGSGELYTVQGVRLTLVLSSTDPLVKTSDGLLYTRGADLRVYAIGGPTADYICGGMLQMMQARDGTLYLRDGLGRLFTVQGVQTTSVLTGTDPLVKTNDGVLYTRGADGRVYAIGGPTADYICGGMQQLMQARDGTLYVRDGLGRLFTIQGVQITSVLTGTDPLVKTNDGLLYTRGADGRVYAIGGPTADYICGGMLQMMQARDGTLYVRDGLGRLFTIQGVQITSVLTGTDPLVKTNDGLLYTRGADGRVYAIGGPTADYICGGMQQLMQATDGTLFVRDGSGRLFKVQGVQMTLILNGTDPLLKGSDGTLYTLAADGWVYGIREKIPQLFGGTAQLMQAVDGTIYMRGVNGTLSRVHDFTQADQVLTGTGPLLRGVDGTLYTLAADGWVYGIREKIPQLFGGTAQLMQAVDGTIYVRGVNGTLSRVHDFTQADQVLTWTGPLLRGVDGTLYTLAADGWVYGIREKIPQLFGGTAQLMQAVDGTIYMRALNGTLSRVHDFTQADQVLTGTGPLLRGVDGTLYTLAADGWVYGIREKIPQLFGGTAQLMQAVDGTIYMRASNGTLSRVHDFTQADEVLTGTGPLLKGSDGTLYTLAADGWVYGIREKIPQLFGGTAQLMQAVDGTIYMRSLNGTLSRVHDFTQAEQVLTGTGPLLKGSDGTLYTLAADGWVYGIRDRIPQVFRATQLEQAVDGSVYMLTVSGTLYMLRDFTQADEVLRGTGSLLRGSDGTLYTRTSNGWFYGIHEKVRLFCDTAQLTQAVDGTAYVRTLDGILYRVDALNQANRVVILDGSLYRLHEITQADQVLTGTGPLFKANDGTLYTLAADGWVYGIREKIPQLFGGTTQLMQSVDGTIYVRSSTGTLSKIIAFTETEQVLTGTGPLLRGGDGTLYTLGADGWVYAIRETGPNFCGGTTQLMQSVDGTIYVRSSTGTMSKIIAFTETQEVLTGTGPLLRGGDGTLYTLGADGWVYAIRETGPNFCGGTTQLMQSVDGTIYVRSSTGTMSKIIAFTETQEVLTGTGPLLRGGDGTLYTLGADGWVYGIREKIPQLFGGTAQLMQSVDGTIYVRSSTGTMSKIIAFTETQEVLTGTGPLLRGGDGTLYTLAADGWVYGIREKIPQLWDQTAQMMQAVDGTIYLRRGLSGTTLSRIREFKQIEDVLTGTGPLLRGGNGSLYSLIHTPGEATWLRALDGTLQRVEDLNQLDQLLTGTGLQLGGFNPIARFESYTKARSGSLGSLSNNLWASLESSANGAWANLESSANDLWTSLENSANDLWKYANDHWEDFITIADAHWKAFVTYANARWQAFESYADVRWQTVESWGNARWNAFENWADERWQAGENWAAARWQVGESWVTDRGQAFENWWSERWQAVERVFEGDRNSAAQVYRITVTSKGGNVYGIDVGLAEPGENMRAIRVTVEHNGQEIKNEYVPTGDWWQTSRESYQTEFTGDAPGDYKITIELKNRFDEWYEEESLTVTLPFTGSVTIYCDPDPDPDTTSGGPGNNQSGSSTTTTAVIYEQSAAELKRGFALPQVLSTAGVYVEDGSLVLGFDMVEVTPETEVEVILGKTDASGVALSESGETEAAFRARVDAEIEKQTRLVEAYTKFPEWYMNVYGKTLQQEFEQTNQARAMFGNPPITDDEFIDGETWGNGTWQKLYPGSIGTLREAMNADIRLQALRSQVWTQSMQSFSLHPQEIEDGWHIPDSVAKSTTAQWDVSVTVKESRHSEPKTTKLDERLGANLFNRVSEARLDAQTKMNNWREWWSVYKTERAFERELETIRKLQNYNVIRGIGDAFRMSQEDMEDLFGAFPGIGFFISAGRTYMYAKDGNIAGAAFEGAFVLMDIFTSGLGQAAVQKVGKLVPFGKTGKKVVELDADFVKQGGPIIAQEFEVGLKSLKRFQTELKEVGMDPVHAKKLGQFAVLNEEMIVIRSSNPASLQYQGKAGFKPKSSALSIKTDAESGLVKASKMNDGTLLDVTGNEATFVNVKGEATGCVVLDDGRIFLKGQDGTDTGFRLTQDGFVVDGAGNKFYSDYDLLGVYEEQVGSTNIWQSVPTGDQTAPSPFVDKLNTAVAGELNLFQHGANDDFWKVGIGEVKLGNPVIGDRFIVAHPNGQVQILDLAQLKELYTSKNIPWPLDG